MTKGQSTFAIVALVAVIAAVVLAISLQPKQPNFAGNSGYQEQPAQYRAGGPGCEPAKINSLPVKARQSKADTCGEAAEQHREATNNLISNRRAAIAAEANASYAAAQANIEAWGAATGLLTLVAAVFAALFAERAAFHTERSAKAAELMAADNAVAVGVAVDANNAAREANEITRQSFEVENRPILQFNGLAMEPWRPDGVLLKGYWSNVGRLPALPLRTEIYRSYTPGNPNDADIAALRAHGPAQSADVSAVIIPNGQTHSSPGASIMAPQLGLRDLGENSAASGIPRYVAEQFALIIARVEYRAAIGTSQTWETEQVIAVAPYYSAPGVLRTDDFGTGPPTTLHMT